MQLSDHAHGVRMLPVRVMSRHRLLRVAGGNVAVAAATATAVVVVLAGSRSVGRSGGRGRKPVPGKMNALRLKNLRGAFCVCILLIPNRHNCGCPIHRVYAMSGIFAEARTALPSCQHRI